eukprot:15434735-Alexandrium_andersonii.AAC.1
MCSPKHSVPTLQPKLASRCGFPRSFSQAFRCHSLPPCAQTYFTRGSALGAATVEEQGAAPGNHLWHRACPASS